MSSGVPVGDTFALVATFGRCYTSSEIASAGEIGDAIAFRGCCINELSTRAKMHPLRMGHGC